MSKKPTITPRAPLVEKMPVWEYLGYRPWTMTREHDDEVIFLSGITRLSDMPQAMKNLFGNNQRYLNGLCRQNARAKEAQAFEELEDAYYSGDFFRGPEDWDWILLEERFPPEIRTWKQEIRRRFDGGQGLSDRKRQLIQSIVEPIWEDAKFTFGRVQDLCEEIQQGTSNGYSRTGHLLHRGLLLRIKQSIDTGLADETDDPGCTRDTVHFILSQTMAKEKQLWQELSTVIENAPD